MHSFKFANKLLSTKTMRDQYYTHIYPHLILQISIWGTNDSSKTYIQPLIKAQKKILRLITNQSPKTHTKPIMKALSILSITSLYTLRVCAEMHPFIHPKKQLNRPEHNHNYTQTSSVHNHATRLAKQNHQFINYSTEHLTKQYAKTWNSIPAQLRNITSASTFKTQLKTHLLKQQQKH